MGLQEKRLQATISICIARFQIHCCLPLCTYLLYT